MRRGRALPDCAEENRKGIVKRSAFSYVVAALLPGLSYFMSLDRKSVV
jgi:hypothetical protein